jgi:hypothetical protein
MKAYPVSKTSTKLSGGTPHCGAKCITGLAKIIISGS